MKQELFDKNVAAVCREALNSNARLSDWEISFLKDLPKKSQRFGTITPRQRYKLNQIAKKTHVTTKYNPQKQKPVITEIMLKDLIQIANKLTDKEKSFLRTQIREQKQRGNTFLNKQKLYQIHRKYYQ